MNDQPINDQPMNDQPIDQLLEKDALYWQLWFENLAFLKKNHWWWYYHRLNGSIKNRQERERLRRSAEAEDQVAERIRNLGYRVYHTTPNSPFDLWVVDDRDRAARVEVKLSTYHANPGHGGRFQADVRQREQCDILVWIARNGRDWVYVIPVARLAHRRNLAIWSECPGNYRGQWAGYLEAWQYLPQVLAGRPYQLSLPADHPSAHLRLKGPAGGE